MDTHQLDGLDKILAGTADAALIQDISQINHSGRELYKHEISILIILTNNRLLIMYPFMYHLNYQSSQQNHMNTRHFHQKECVLGISFVATYINACKTWHRSQNS